MIDPLLGTEVARYRIVRLLGEGGMGRVYLAVQPEIGSRVAIKVLAAESAGSPELVQRFFDEARAVNLIAHEHIAAILDLDRLPGGLPYIVMEYVPGNTLRTLVEQGPLPIAGIVRIGTEMLQALEAAHAAGIVHRDLKPDNVMVTLAGHVKLLDFGIAKLARDPRSGDTPRTRTGAMIGTPEYMAPEQIRGWAVDARTDLYAVGLVLYETATGVRPFTGDSDFEVMEKHMREEPRDPRVLRPDLPSPLAAVILAALNKSPQQRFQSARAMGNALGAVTPGTFDGWNALASRAWRADDVPLDTDLRTARTIGARSVPRAERGPSRIWRYALVAAIIATACAITFAIARRPTAPATYDPPPPPVKIDAAAPVRIDPTDYERRAREQVIAALPTFPATVGPDERTPRMYAKDHDPARFDPAAYLPRAYEHARAVFPDAKLRGVTWINLTAEGLIEFSEPASGAVYYFESAAARTADPVRTACAVVFSLSSYGMSVTFENRCEGGAVEPHCSGAALHARSQALGLPREMPILASLFPSRSGSPPFVIVAPDWNRSDPLIIANDCAK